MAEWKDTSSYSRDDKIRIPSCFELSISSLGIRVHRHIDYPKHVWLLTCHEISINRYQLKSSESGNAQKEALEIVKRKAQQMILDIETYKYGKATNG